MTRINDLDSEKAGQTIAGTTNACEGTGTCETCEQPIEKRRGIWQHTVSRLIICRGKCGYPIDGYAYPADWRERIAAWRERVRASYHSVDDQCVYCASQGEGTTVIVTGIEQCPLNSGASEFHPQGACGGDCSGCCNEAEWES